MRNARADLTKEKENEKVDTIVFGVLPVPFDGGLWQGSGY